MIRLIDNAINSVTMYRLVTYVLVSLVVLALILSLIGKLPYDTVPLLYSLLLLLLASYLTNKFLSLLYKAPSNIESFLITALILFFLIPPAANIEQIIIVTLTAVIAQTSKYIMAIKKKHIFNPAAFGILIIGYLGLYGPAWWAGNVNLVPFAAIGGLLIVRKIRRFRMFFTFVGVALAVQILFSIARDQNIINTIFLAFTASPLLFFASIMLTEPQTAPPTQKLRLIYASIIGVFYSFQAPIGPLYSSPELALIIGNIFSYILSPKEKLLLTLQKKINEGKNIYSYIFSAEKIPKFVPGQYFEWTLSHKKADNRGNRRFFTIASSPTEKDIRVGVKFNPSSSSFKNELQNMKKGQKIVAGLLAGDFILPKNSSKKMIWMAGGIGATPFRSMTKYLLDKPQKRDIVFFYAANTPDEFAFKDIFSKGKKIGMKTIYIATDHVTDKNWKGEKGYITEKMIKKYVKDYKDRHYFLSGPSTMVDTYKKMLKKLGVKNTQIHTDYFPGY